MSANRFIFLTILIIQILIVSIKIVNAQMLPLASPTPSATPVVDDGRPPDAFSIITPPPTATPTPTPAAVIASPPPVATPTPTPTPIVPYPQTCNCNCPPPSSALFSCTLMKPMDPRTCSQACTDESSTHCGVATTSPPPF